MTQNTVGRPYLCQKCDQLFGSPTVYNKHVRRNVACFTELDKVQCFKNKQGVWTQSQSKHYNTTSPILADGRKLDPKTPVRITPKDVHLIHLLPASTDDLARWTEQSNTSVYYQLQRLGDMVFHYEGKWHKKPNPVEDIDILDRFNHWLESKVPLISGQLNEDGSLGSHLAISERIKKNVDKYNAHAVWYAYVADERKRK